MANLKLTHGSLFSGIGGFDLAASWCGWDNKFHCETNEFCRRVLNHHFPNSKAYGNIKEADFSEYRGRIDVLSGGFPCQPFSVAGKRLGTADERHLWPLMLGAIRQIKPRWIVGENVRGLISWNEGLVFEAVCAELEAEGYQVQPFVLPAAGVDAPHRRDRVWIVAYAERYDDLRTQPGGNGEEETMAGVNGKEDRPSREPGGADHADSAGAKPDERAVANPEIHGAGGRLRQLETEDGREQQSQEHDQDHPEHRYDGNKRDAAHADSHLGRQGWLYQIRSEEAERFSGQPDPCEARDNWQNFPTQPAICVGDDGLSERLVNITFPRWRKEAIQACGNAIVPQVAWQIFRAIDEWERANER